MKKRKLINVIIICIIAILSLAGVIIHINNKRNFKSSNNEQYMAKIVMKGFELSIHDRYMATYDEDMGLMYWNNDHFDMMIDVEDGEYNEDIIDKLDEINRLMESELVVVRPYSEMTIDGKSYTYMLYYDAGIPTIHCYTMADDMHLYSVMVLCNEMSMIKPQTEQEIKEECEQLIKIADSIIRTSNPTDKPNSLSGEVFVGKESYENLYSEVELNLSDKYIDHDYIEGISTNTKVNYGVKQQYYCTGSKSKEGVYYLKMYGDYKGNIITVYLNEYDEINYNVQDIIEEGCKEWTDDNSIVREYKCGDYTLYYYTYVSEYIENNEAVVEYNFVSMVDLGDGYLYIVEGNGDNLDIMNPEFYKDFYDVNLEKTQ